MGDRTFVILTVLKKHAKAVAEIYKQEETTFHKDSKFSHFEFEEVNYDELEELGKLEELGIAFNSDWTQGGDYKPGCRSCRFTPEGDIQQLELYEGEENPPIHELRQRLVKPLQLVEYIKQYDREHTPLPWDNQVEYGKRYRAKQLLKTKETG